MAVSKTTAVFAVALAICCCASAETNSDLAATFYPLTDGQKAALPGDWHPEVGTANNTQVASWLESLQELEGTATGHINYQTTACSIESNCTKAVQVVVLEYSRNANNNPEQPIDCSGYLLVGATTAISGSDWSWNQAFNPQNEFLVQASDITAPNNSCNFVVQYTPGTVAARNKAIAQNEANNAGRRRLLCAPGCDGSVGGCVCDGSGNGPGCFPGEASVEMENGSQRRVNQLNIGDKVAVLGKDGKVTYDHVYVLAHQDKAAAADFVSLALDGSSHNIQLTGGHFIPVASGPEATKLYKRARDVVVGDLVWAMPNGNAQNAGLFKVSDITTENMIGLYNPITLSGSIIVNGVAASVHSDWFLDNIADKLGMTSMLPALYQAVLTPARMLYYTLGKDGYIQLYTFLDNNLGGVETFGTNHGGKVTSAGMIASGVVAGGIFMHFQAKKRIGGHFVKA